MRSFINANLTSTVITNVIVRTVVAGVDALRGSHPLAMRLYAAAPAAEKWQPEAGKPKPAHLGHLSGSESSHRDSSHCRREDSRCRRPRRSGCFSRG